jgi:hypothetical protein
LDNIAKPCGESPWCLIAIYARARAIVLVFDDDVCGGAIRDQHIEIRTQHGDPLFKTLRSAGHTGRARQLQLRPRRHQTYDCPECELIWDIESA